MESDDVPARLLQLVGLDAEVVERLPLRTAAILALAATFAADPMELTGTRV
jgi:hypothetical protein